MRTGAARIAKAIWGYLKDWKNLLTHTLIGVAIILIAAFLPVRPVVRIAVLIVVVGLNTLRMRLERSRRAAAPDGGREREP